jgi:hypothetical protein
MALWKTCTLSSSISAAASNFNTFQTQRVDKPKVLIFLPSFAEQKG